MSAVPKEVHPGDATAEDLRNRIITRVQKYMGGAELQEVAELVCALDAASFSEGQHAAHETWRSGLLAGVVKVVTKAERTSVPKQVAL